MITYVNTVFVANATANYALASTTHNTVDELTASDKDKFVVIDVDTDKIVTNPAGVSRIKIGYITSKTMTLKDGTVVPVIKWYNIINQHDIKSYTYDAYAADTEDTIYIDLSGATGLIGSGKDLSKKGKRIIVRLNFMDLPTRYRKWTESYEYITKDGDTAASIAIGIAKVINGATKRARVIASVGKMNTTSASADATVGSKYFHADSNWNNDSADADDNTIKLVAMTYDDDDSVDSLNWANKVRFNANMYYTDPAAEGWASLNKNFITGAKIDKVPGKTSPASAKLVRDREAQAMGYEGILNRGMGTWPIIKPAMRTKLSDDSGNPMKYGALTLEFENMYRAADDIFRKTKQTVEVYGAYDSTSTRYSFGGLKAFLDVFTNILSTKLDVPSNVQDGHVAEYDVTNGVVTLVDGGANG